MKTEPTVKEEPTDEYENPMNVGNMMVFKAEPKSKEEFDKDSGNMMEIEIEPTAEELYTDEEENDDEEEENDDEDENSDEEDFIPSDEEALEMVLDSEEEFTSSSEEERDSDEERLHFEERLDPAEDFIPDECDENGADHPVANVQPTVSWKTEASVDAAPRALRFMPAKEPGPQLRPCDAHTPGSLFKEFFSKTAVSTLCRNTNAQAARPHAKGHRYKWSDVGVGEMYSYCGLLFFMATVKLRSITDYWRQDGAFSIAFPASVMSRDRYRTISWNLHMSDPAADEGNDRKRGTPEHDPLFRIRPLVDAIRHACVAIYHPRKNMAVHERTLACKGNAGMIPKAKPRFKLFSLSDSSNGYTVAFAVYTGRSRFPTGSHGLSYDAVTSLLDRRVLGSGYHVYMDHFYTSPELLSHLFASKFGACGTYRDRKGCPRGAGHQERGSVRWIRDGHLAFVKWMDAREVSLCSTIHAANTVGAKQRKKQNGRRRTKSFPSPAAVSAYKQHAGGADLDQLVQYYATQHKTMKWYREIFLHFLDIAATNAFIVHKELYGTLSHSEFMEELIADLCGASQKRVPVVDHVPVPGAGRRICALCKTKHGKRHDATWKCQTCDVHLCVQVKRNCFLEWHKDV